MRKTAKEIADDVVKKTDERSWLSRHAPLLAGVGLTGLGYGLSRRPSFSKNPILRKMQKDTGGEFYHTPYDYITPKEYAKLPWYTKLKRRFMYGPEAPAEWSEAEKAFKIDPALAEKVRKNQAAVARFGEQYPIEGKMPAFSEEAQKVQWGEANSLPTERGVPKSMEDKLFEMQVLEKHAPGTGIKTRPISDIMDENNIYLDPQQGEFFERNLQDLQGELRKQYPQGFFLKPRFGDAASSGMFPTDKSDFVKLYRDWGKMRPEYKAHQARVERAVATGKGTNANEAAEKYRKQEGYSGRVFDPEFLNDLMVQEKINIQKHAPEVASRMRATGAGPTKEFRIHSMGGEIIPGLSSPRYFTGAVKDLVTEHPAANAAGRWFQKKVLSRLPKEYQGIPMAADIAPIEGGGYRVVELNPEFRSGVLMKTPFGGQHVYKHMTGRYTPEMSAIRGLGLGGLGAGAVAGGQAVYNKATTQEEIPRV
jgi:hypothetical protein